MPVSQESTAVRTSTPPTPHYPDLSLSPDIDSEQIQRNLNPSHNHEVIEELSTLVQAPFTEESSPSGNDEAIRNLPAVVQAPFTEELSPSNNPEVTKKPSTVVQAPGQFTEKFGSSVHPEVAGTYTEKPEQSSQAFEGPFSSPAQIQQDLSKERMITPSSTDRNEAPSMPQSSGFVDNGVTASFNPSIRLSPSLRESQDTSPTALTEMRESRLRAKEAEEGQAKNIEYDEKTNMEEGASITQRRMQYPEHPSFYTRKEYATLARKQHRIASEFQESTPQISPSMPSTGHQAHTDPTLDPSFNSSGDSLRVFPPTTAGTTASRFVPSSNDDANPRPNYLAGVSISEISPFRTSCPLKSIPTESLP